ncbi:hypothetical protein CFIMG_007230RA00001 [Ceratocystis fimbriata CBS 114723]|uniref:Uncharacterized protein n=1 Tax=Ceratocystis fimbriata CBS 114723 TaxID=1035309 RepID=A0A2C5X025_9PEZI|nr:hypothetical protein CFIMG_007230RA00001 [Ceratocystis fimbriata CBS 114723]
MDAYKNDHLIHALAYYRKLRPIADNEYVTASITPAMSGEWHRFAAFWLYADIESMLTDTSVNEIRVQEKGVHRAQKKLRPSGGTSGDNAKNAKELRIAIASSIANCVSIRCALNIRMYIDGTPLRGRMSQPLFQRKGLLHIHLEKAALPPMKNMMTQASKHLVILFPLLAQTAQVAGSSGDEPVFKVVMEAMAVMGVEMDAVPKATLPFRSR